MLRRLLIVAGVGFLALQLVPYGWFHPNPAVTEAAVWPSPEAETIARESCYDCHSNETRWGPQSYVAPSSWLVRWDVERGREDLNFSTWDRDREEAHDAAEEVEDGTMPPRRYTIVHPDASLSPEEAEVLVAALEAMEEGAEAEEEAEAEEDGVDNSGPGNAEDRGGSDNSGPGSGDD